MSWQFPFHTESQYILNLKIVYKSVIQIHFLQKYLIQALIRRAREPKFALSYFAFVDVLENPFIFVFAFGLVVEETNTCKAHGNSIVVTGLRDLGVLNAATRLGNVRDTKLGCVVDGIPEWKEGVARNCNPGGLL